ncbi:hypothetical protein BKA56DRAFT_108563 [Ilyonectria sp. MPI-CAGE-AT-0026]|nr:hypothetical protein BKA56DRAFT_108563 [Ilyonectria sp. MPI-CAGE-AT-0026]
MHYRMFKILSGKRFTTYSASGRSGWQLSRNLRLFSSVPPSSLQGSSAYWDPHPREFSRHCGQLLYSSAFSWERASTEDHRSALTHLSTTTDICERTSEFTPLVNNVLNQILLEHSFVDETPKLLSHSQSLHSAIPVSQSNRSSLKSKASCVRGDLHTVSDAYPAWKTPSLVAVSEAVPELGGIHSEDAKVLLVLLSFLSTSDKIPLDLLFRGAAPRKRWTAQGEIEGVDAIHTGLAPELCSLLSDMSRLGNAFHEPDLSSAVFKNDDQTYTLDKVVASRARERLSAEELSFWRRQVLIVAYRAVPWKYIEPGTKITKLFLPHLKFTLQAFQDCSEYLSTSTRADLGLTLIEASRFPNMTGKRFAVSQAEIASRDLEDQYLHCCIAQSRSLLSRIAGNMDHANSSIEDLVQGRVVSLMDTRMHSAIGLATIQRSLNCIQVEDLSTSKRVLESWSPLGQNLSSHEKVVSFRKHMILGRVLRLQGSFRESLMLFEKAQKTVAQCQGLIFDEDLRDLTCDHADTLRELDDPESAENQLRTEIARRDQSCSFLGKSLLELSLAEALFAQGRFQDAERLCLSVQSRPDLLKFGKLRLQIIMAKLRHVQSDNEGALSYWSGAMKEIRKFQLTNGRTTRIIVLSICDTLSGLGQTWLVDESLKQVAYLDAMATPGGVQCWIAGMGHWLKYLSSQSLRSRI